MWRLEFSKTLKYQRKSLAGRRIWKKNSRGSTAQLLKKDSLPSTRMFPLSMIMVECSLSIKDTVSFDVVEAVVGSSQEYVLTKM